MVPSWGHLYNYSYSIFFYLILGRVTLFRCGFAGNQCEGVRRLSSAPLQFHSCSLAGKTCEGLFSALVRLDGQDHQQTFQCGSAPTVPPRRDPELKVLQLTEALRALLEGQVSPEEQDSLRRRVSGDTAQVILEWLAREQVGSASHQSRRTNLTAGLMLHFLKSSYRTERRRQQRLKMFNITSDVCAGSFHGCILRQRRQ